MNAQLTKNQVIERPVLYVDAIFSGMSGLAFTFASRPISTFLGLDAPGVIFGLGWVMIGYAALLAYVLARRPVPPGFVLFTVIANSLWVLASLALLLTGWVPFSAAGKWAVGIAALAVDILATLQWLDWRQMTR